MISAVYQLVEQTIIEHRPPSGQIIALAVDMLVGRIDPIVGDRCAGRTVIGTDFAAIVKILAHAGATHRANEHA